MGNIMNGKKVSTNSNLQFYSRDVVHVILDYSNPNNWIFYAKVGDIEEEDYDDLLSSNKINPGSYRLAVSLYSQGDTLVFESCKIHGNEEAEFYQELKSFITDTRTEKEEQEEEEEHNEEEQVQIEKDKEEETESNTN